eukprot:XP_001699428.1 predicted protein [Chlamydomonas reinhardtii]
MLQNLLAGPGLKVAFVSLFGAASNGGSGRCSAGPGGGGMHVRNRGSRRGNVQQQGWSVVPHQNQAAPARTVG